MRAFVYILQIQEDYTLIACSYCPGETPRDFYFLIFTAFLFDIFIKCI